MRKSKRAVVKRAEGSVRVVASEAEFAGSAETAHLLRSPRNAQRLLGALSRATGGGRRGRNSLSGR